MVESVNQEVERDDAPLQTERDTPEKRPSVRESLERTFEDAHKEEEKETRSRRDTRRDTNRRDASGNFEAPEKETDKPETGEVEAEAAETESSQGTQVQNQAPTAWTADAKKAWAELPPQVQAAVTKREQDVEKGIKSLKDQYSELDKAIAPHKEAIQKFGKTPGQAVEQLFAWFQALAQNPDQAIPALIQSYNYDPRKIIQAFGIQPQAAQEPVKEVEQPEGDIPPAVQSYITKLEERLTGFEQKVGQSLNGVMGSFQEQSMAKTHEILNTWAKDKPYFNEVRAFMGHLLTPDPNTGVAAVPLKDGRVDLDTAYDMATYAHPEVRAKVLADQQAKAAAEKQAKIKAENDLQQKQANKARQASGSVVSSTPGAEVARKQIVKGKSVRESLKDAMSELSS